MQQSIDTHAGNAIAHTHARTNPVLVYAILAIFTLLEVTITVTGGLPRQTLIPLLLAISFVKASLVALYYMHLRYEKAIYGIVFIIPAAFAVFLITVLLSG
ncbi:MAG: cytochrome C oxidase subunit IV family protein [Chloroflexi bacterium]|nr:cytochrome C oxidase subunit IV family protein [Chloroflexota bacterium]